MKIKKSVMWQGISAILAVALIISILTGGFKLTGGDSDADTTGEDSAAADGEISVIALSDERCEECDTAPIIAQLQGIFPSLEVTELDYNDEEGKELYEDSGLTALPALLFTDSVEDAANYAQIQDYLDEAGDYISLRVGAAFDPTAEICDNEVDDTGNGKTDCEDSSCEDKLICNADALADCAEENDVSAETVIFYYSDTCPWCTKMKPGVEELEEEGYEFLWANTADADTNAVIDECFRDYMGSGVPQFICPKTGKIQGGAFVNADKELDVDLMKAFADACKE